MSEPARNADGLESLFGYAALERVYGWKRRQLENAMRDGLLTRPMYAGKRAYWTADQIDAYIAKLRGARAREAVATPDDIAPERIEHALDVLATRWAQQRGIELPPGSQLALNVPLTDEQRAQQANAAAEARDESASNVLNALSGLDQVAGMVVAAGLIPALLPIAQHLCGVLADDILAGTDQDRRTLALDILGNAIGGEVVGPK